MLQSLKAGLGGAARFTAFAVLALAPAISDARIGVEYQMALGNPSGAVTDAAQRTNYLIARDQYVISYNDDTHQANWVSWSISASDSGSSGRTDAWAVESALPTGYLKIGTASFGTGWDRGHMCPSGDRTTSVADNEFTFRMSNMIPQASSNNQGLWANFETYCRSLTSDGSEMLIVSGPSGFTGSTISNGMQIPGNVWKVAVKVPDGVGSAATRVSTGCRVIAINTPNTSTGLGSWQSYITSVEQIEENTGLHFFTNVDPTVATYLKNVVDTGSASNSPTVITSFSPGSGAVGINVSIAGYNFGTSPVVKFNGVTAVSTVMNSSLIVATVPTGATTGEITVTGTGGTDISASLFTVLGGSSPLLNLSIPSLASFTTIQGAASASQSYTVTGTNLGGNVTITAPTNFELSLDDSVFTSGLTLIPTDGILASVPVHVRVQSTAPLGAIGGSITHTGGGATPQSLAVSGTVNSTAPTLILSSQSLSGFTAALGTAGASKSYSLSGTNLTGAISITAPAGFQLSLDDLAFAPSLTLTPTSGNLSAVPVHVRMQASQAVGAITGQISHSGGGATTQNLAVSGTVTNTSGQVVKLAAWEVTGLSNYGPSPFTATASDANVTLGGLTRGSGITLLNTAAGSAWGGNGFDGTSVLADAITRGDYATFSITPVSGIQLSFSSIPAYNIRRSSTGPTTGQWQYQVGTGAFQNIGSAITWGGLTTSAGNPQSLITLSGIADLQNVASGVPVTFRLVTYGATGATGNFYLNNITGDDLAVMGTASTTTLSTTPVIASAGTASATAFESFSYQITASNTPTSFAASGLPGGLSVDTVTGLISGIPLVTGTYHVNLTATNSSGDGTAELVITVSPNPGAPAIGGTLAATGRLRSAFEYQIQSTNSPTAWLASNLPPGLEINNATGLISGTPTVAGTYLVPLTVQNPLGSDAKSLTLTIVDPTINLTSSGLADFTANFGSASPVQSYSVSASSLSGAVTLQAPEGFEISVGSSAFSPSLVLDPINGDIASTPVSVRLAASSPLGVYSGSIIHSGGGAIPKYLSASGTVSALLPTIGLSVSTLNGFTAKLGSVSFSQSYTVSGVSLTGPITVTAPLNYEVSLDDGSFAGSVMLNPVSGSLASIPVYVRLASSASIGTALGTITHSGGGAPSMGLPLSGSVSGLTGPVITSTTSGSVYVGGSFSYSITVEGTPTMVGYGATGLPAGLAINTATGVITGSPSVAGTSVINLQATSTDGTTSATYTLKVVSAAEQAAIPLSVVVNKFQNATVDKVELLVTGDTIAGPSVDMRGMILKDFDSNMGSDLGGRFVFKSIPFWSAVKAGTLIVVSSGQSEVEDLDPSDFVLRINLGNSAYFVSAGGTFDISTTDMVMLKPADCGVDGVAGAIHALAAGNSGTQYSLFSGKKMRSSRLSTNNGNYCYSINSQAKLSDYYSSSGASTAQSLTFGSANNSTNNTYINSLRGLDQTPPVVTLAGNASVILPFGGTYLEQGATSLDAKDGVRSVTTSGTVNPLALGTYTLTYTATDLSGNIGTATRTVSVTDQTAPVVTLNGAASIRMPAGLSFVDPGASAIDAVDGTVAIHVSGTVNVTAPGNYTLSYSATDAAGNTSATATRTIVVVSAFNYAMTDTYGLVGGQAAAGADPDGDGWTNVQEHAFGLNPTVPGGRLMNSEIVGGTLRITYLQRAGVVYTVESTSDLKTWATGAVVPTLSSSQPQAIPAGYTQYEASLPMVNGQGFMRVRATVP